MFTDYGNRFDTDSLLTAPFLRLVDGVSQVRKSSESTARLA